MENKIKIGNIDLASLTTEKELELFNYLKEKQEKIGSDFVIVRSDRAGVFFGIVDKYLANNIVVLNKCRRIFYWNKSASLSQLAIDGTNDPSCKFSVPTSNHLIAGVIEIIPCTKKAEEKISSVPEWRA